MPILGCIADDFTGATDLASQLMASGLQTVQVIGIPKTEIATEIADIDAVVVALKSRTAPTEEAVADSVGALDWLRKIGCRQFYFKYCSTFDSTSKGNIGPVTDALMAELKTNFTVVCPAFPANARTIFNGHLFADGMLLNESGMQDHPLTPMTDANIVRVMSAQSRHAVGLVPYHTIRQGTASVAACFKDLHSSGKSIAILDCIDDENLKILGSACANLKLVTGGSGLGLGLGNHWQNHTSTGPASILHSVTGAELILSGSCSTATRTQIKHAKKTYPSHFLDVFALADDFEATLDQALSFCRKKLANGPVLIYASSKPNIVAHAQEELGPTAATLIERAMGQLAQTLVAENHVRRLLVAGGETSGAVVKALNVHALQIGPSIASGVPWTTTIGRKPRLALALKSGNFGGEDFMTKAWTLLR